LDDGKEVCCELVAARRTDTVRYRRDHPVTGRIADGAKSTRMTDAVEKGKNELNEFFSCAPDETSIL